jgi:PhzF family phenazine biosynthesis protein
MIRIRFLQIDAFTDRPFSGNPAAVCLLPDARDDSWMQSVAAEMNLSETAFLRQRTEDGFDLRWFTPKTEVDLCGHATLAAAHALWADGLAAPEDTVRFHTRSGLLPCTRRGTQIEMDFPAGPVEATASSAELAGALGVEPVFVGRSGSRLLVTVESERILRAVAPDFARLRKIPAQGVIATCRSDAPDFDFVSRYFAPAVGIDEDPVTGSAHCSLGPFWSERLGKTQMTARQASSRGGIVRVGVYGDRVVLGGRAVTVLEGVLLDS